MMHLDRLLTEISEALRAGQFERLSTLSAMLDTVLPPQDPVSLRTIARIARENALTLAAAAKGLRAAQRRITALRAGTTLTTYDNAGQKRHHAAMTGQAHRL